MYVGVILVSIGELMEDEGIPHVCGGDPQLIDLADINCSIPPYVCGGDPYLPPLNYLKTYSPMYVGVILINVVRQRIRHGIPMYGGDPQQRIDQTLSISIPHVCGGDPNGSNGRQHPIVPMYVGVILTTH